MTNLISYPFTLALVVGENYGVGLETDRPHFGEHLLLGLILGFLFFLILIIGILAWNFTRRAKKLREQNLENHSELPQQVTNLPQGAATTNSEAPWSRHPDWWKNK